MFIELDVTARVILPTPQDPNLQSLYVFNMYRAASSLTVALGEELAAVTNRVPVSVPAVLWRMGVSLIDPADYRRSSAFLSRTGTDLLRLCDFGGFVYVGFREVPQGFANGFTHIGATCLIVRDLRDVGISHYFAVNKHAAPDSVSGDEVRALREIVGSVTLEQYLLRGDTISFLRRIADCYAPLLDRGMTVIRYEDAVDSDGNFVLDQLIMAFVNAYSSYLPLSFDLECYTAGVNRRIENSRSLRDHGTSGRIGLHKTLSDAVLSEYTARLAPSLALLGYEQ